MWEKSSMFIRVKENETCIAFSVINKTGNHAPPI